MKGKKIIPIFVPHIGCPHDCIFCNQRKITGLQTDMNAETAKGIIKEYLQTIDTKSNDVEIAFFGGSFTAIDISFQRELLSVASEYKKAGKVKDIRLSTRPDAIDEKRLKILKEYGVTIIELGVQSMDENVLKSSIRGHDSNVVRTSANMVREYGFTLGLQMMVGLPDDNEQKCIYTAREFVKLHPDFVRIYPTLVVRDTGLERDYERGNYVPFDVEKTVEIVKKLMVIYSLNDINIIRVGLQPTENITMGNQVVAGPYHPAIREKVESRIYRNFICSIAEDGAEKKVTVRAAKKNMSKIIGNKKENLIYFKSRGTELAVVEDNTVSTNSLKILFGEKELDFSLYQIYKCLEKMYFRED